MIEHVLIENGLSEKEAKLYLTVLQKGEAPIGELAKASDLKRTTLYTIVENLQQRNILHVQKRDKVQYVSALPPRVLIERFKQSAQMAENVLPELMKLAYEPGDEDEIVSLDSHEIQKILRDFAQEKGPIRGTLSMGNAAFEKLETLLKDRQPLHQPDQLLISNNQAGQLLGAQVIEPQQVRFVEMNQSDENTNIFLLINSNKILFLSASSTEVSGQIVHSKAVYNSLSIQWNMLWQLSGVTMQGWKEMERI